MLKQAIITDLSANMMFAGISKPRKQTFTFNLFVAELYEFHISFAKKMETVLSDWDTTETGIGALFVEHVCQPLYLLVYTLFDNVFRLRNSKNYISDSLITIQYPKSALKRKKKKMLHTQTL